MELFYETPGGRAKLYLGDARRLTMIEDESVDLVITSPPYNTGKPYPGPGDERPWPEWYDFMSDIFLQCEAKLREGGVLAVVIPGVIKWQRDHKFAKTWWDYDANYLTHRGSQRNVRGKGRIEPVGFMLFDTMQQQGFKMREPIVWIKGSNGQAISSHYRMGCDSDPYLRGCYEFILLGSKGRWYHNGGTGRRGAEAVPFIDYTKDVWHIPPVSGEHPAPFPKEIPLRLIRLFIHRANTQELPEPVVFDPFVGSGTTCHVAYELGVRSIGVDIVEEYLEMSKKRLLQGVLL